MKYKVLFNPLACGCKGRERADRLNDVLKGSELDFMDVTATDLSRFSEIFSPTDNIIIAGGDGTLNIFVNSVDTDAIQNSVFLFPCGSGNDFINDVASGCRDSIFPLNQYLGNLPRVTVNGRSYKFVNGVGFGIDGYCCEVADNIRGRNSKRNINYASIAINGLLFHYKPRTVTVEADGKATVLKEAWLAPVMNGRMYGGGMIPTPGQKRVAAPGEKKLSAMVMYGRSKLKTLLLFPKMFKGEHLKNTRKTALFEGRKIKVTYSSPCACQIDGETITGVSSIEAEV